MLTDLDDAVAMAIEVPLYLDPAIRQLHFLLDARYLSFAVMGKGHVDSAGDKQVRNVLEARCSDGAMDVDAEQRLIVYLGEQLGLIAELEMCTQPRIYHAPECSTLGVVVDSLRMQEAADALPVGIGPGAGQEALVEVGLLACQLRVVLGGVEEGLAALGLGQLGEPGGFKLGTAGKGSLALIAQLLGTQVMEHEAGVVVAEDAALLPLHLAPGRVTQCDIEAAAVGEDIGEGQLPVEEAVVLTQVVCQLQGGEEGVGEELLQVELATLVAYLAGGARLFTQALLGLVGGEEVVDRLGEEVLAIAAFRRVATAQQAFLLRGEGEGAGAVEDGVEVEEPLLAVGQLVDLFQGPEPERAPVVHGELEAPVGRGDAGVSIEDAAGADVVLGLGADVALLAARLAPQGIAVLGAAPVFGEHLGVLAPQAVHGIGKALQGADLVVVQRGAEGLLPRLDRLERLGAELLGHLVAVADHARVGEQEVVDFVRAAASAGVIV